MTGVFSIVLHSIRTRLLLFFSAAATMLAACGETPSIAIEVTGEEWGSIASEPPGIDCGLKCTASFQPGRKVVLRPTVSAHGEFVGWGGACSGQGACVLTVSQEMLVTAEFRPKLYRVTVAAGGVGRGTVEVAMHPECEEACSLDLPFGSALQLTAKPNAISYLQEWSSVCAGSGSTCEFVVDGDATVTAFFDRKRRLQIELRGPENAGIVISDPPGISCSPWCNLWVLPGTSVQLTAKPKDGHHRFRGWEGACEGVGTCEIVVQHDVSVVGTFAAVHIWSREYPAVFLTVASAGLNDVIVALPSSVPTELGGGLVYPIQILRSSVMMARYNASGTHQWSKAFGGDGHVSVMSLLPSSGGVVLGGQVQSGQAQFGSSSITAGSGALVGFWAEVDGAGTPISATSSSEYHSRVAQMTMMENGDLAAVVHDMTTFPIAAAIIRMDSAGTVQWTKAVGTTATIKAATGGALWSVNGGDPLVSSCATEGVTGASLVRIDANGGCEPSWTPPRGFQITSLGSSSDGAPVIFGRYFEAVTIGAQTLPASIGPVHANVAIVAFDSSGVPIWAKAFWSHLDGTPTLAFSSIAVLENGDILAGGVYRGKTNFAPYEMAEGTAPFLIHLAKETGLAKWVDADALGAQNSGASLQSISPLPGQRAAVAWGISMGSATMAGVTHSASSTSHFLTLISP